MKVAFKWKVTNNKYLYITDKGAAEGFYDKPFIFDSVASACTYSGMTVTGMTPTLLQENTIKENAAAMTESEYKANFNEMVALAATDEDARKFKFMDYSAYFNLESDACVSEALIPICEADHDNINVEANVSMRFAIVGGSAVKMTEKAIEVDVPDGVLNVDSDNLTMTCSSLTASFDGTTDKIDFRKNGSKTSMTVVTDSVIVNSDDNISFHSGEVNVGGGNILISGDTVTIKDKTSETIRLSPQSIIINEGDRSKGSIELRGVKEDLSGNKYKAFLRIGNNNSNVNNFYEQTFHEDFTDAKEIVYETEVDVIGGNISKYINGISTENKARWFNKALPQERTIKSRVEASYDSTSKIIKADASYVVDLVGTKGITREFLKINDNYEYDPSTKKETETVTTTLRGDNIDIKGGSSVNITGGTVNVNGVNLSKLANAPTKVITSTTVSLKTTLVNDEKQLEAHVVNSSITQTHIATDAVVTMKIKDKNVTTDKLADSAVTEGKIYSSAVTASKIAANAVTTNKIANTAVTTDKIANKSVTSDKLANSSVTTSKIDSAAITKNKVETNLANAIPPIGSVMVWAGGVGIAVPDGWVDISDPNSSAFTFTISYNSDPRAMQKFTANSNITFNDKTITAAELNTLLNKTVQYKTSTHYYTLYFFQQFNQQNYNTIYDLLTEEPTASYTIIMPYIAPPSNFRFNFPMRTLGESITRTCYIMRYK